MSNKIKQAIRDLQLYIDVKWGGRNDMLNLALTALKDFCKLQQENEQLKVECNRFKERLQISPYGDDKIDELDEALENYKFQYEQLKQKIKQLRAQVAKTKEALTIANNYMPDVGHFCTCGKCKTCGADINYAGYGYCLKCARDIIDTALSDTPKNKEGGKTK